MNKYEDKILNRLLKAYEDSVVSKEGSIRNLKIKRKIQVLFKKYNNSDSYQEHLDIDEACYHLKEKGFITLSCDEDGDILEVILNLDNDSIDACYKYTGRENIRKTQKEMIDYLSSIKTSKKWIQKYIDDNINALQQYRSISKSIDELNEIMLILESLEEQEKEISLRKYSLKILKDSKRLEKIQGTIQNILVQYYNQDFSGLDIDEVFSYFNIMKNPSFVYVQGNMIIELNGQIIDIGKLNSPFSLSNDNIKNLNIIDIKDTSVLTIENLTSFYDTHLNDTLHIYLGGYHNKVRRELLMKIYEFNQHLQFYHFGDIDAGGFYIWKHLVNETHIPFCRLAMDLPTLLQYKDYCKHLEGNDLHRLELLKEDIDDEVIDYMINHDCKLEQEIIELDENI